MRVYSNATSETYPLSRKPAIIGINKANVSAYQILGGGEDVVFLRRQAWRKRAALPARDQTRADPEIWEALVRRKADKGFIL